MDCKQKIPTTIIPGSLAFMSASQQVMKTVKAANEKSLRFISSDLHNNYHPYASDFGPVSLGIVHRFCVAFSKKMANADKRVLVYCFEETLQAQANASFLLGSFLVVCIGWTPEKAAEPFVGASSVLRLRPFRDATFEPDSYPLNLADCLKGLAKSISLGWFDWRTFDAQRYGELDSPHSGDIHVICPKLVAFKGPLAIDSHHLEANEVCFPPAHYAPLLLSLGASSVVRLNDADTYPKTDFERAGLAHHDLFFTDCTVPSDAVIERFLDLCDAAPGAVAVHCRAGLGRTGTLIGLWLMKHAGFGANEAMGWLRIVRPGSVIGQQQAFLLACEGRAWRGNRLLQPVASTLPPLGRRNPSSASGNRRRGSRRDAAVADESAGPSPAAAAELARQVTAGMCARGAARRAAAAEAGGPGRGALESRRGSMVREKPKPEAASELG